MLSTVVSTIRRHKVALAAAAAAPLFVLAAGPASAASSETAHIVGHGTIGPGLTTTPTFQSSVTFQSDAVVFAGQVANGAGASCTFNGASTIAETLQQGQGAGGIACNGGSPDNISLAGNVIYTRTGGTVTITGSGSGSVNGRPESCTITAGVFHFQPTTAPTVTAYRLEGNVALSCNP
jgi:hypothetical protein